MKFANSPILFFIPLAAFLLCTGSEAAPPKEKRTQVITLEEAYDRTLATDQSIAIANLGIEQAKLERASAWTKALPTLSAGGTLSRQDNRPGGGSTVGASTLSKNSGGGNISLQQPILDLSLLPALRRGKLAIASSSMDFRQQIRNTLFGVAQAYYDVLSQQELVKVDQNVLQLAEEQFNLAQNRANFGEVTRTDVLRAQVTVESTRRTLVQDTALLASLKNILANILNLPAGSEFSLKEPGNYPGDIPPFDKLLYKALSEREDLRSRDLLIQQNEQRIKEIHGSYAPRISAGLNANTSDQNSRFNDFNNDMQGSISLNIPLYSAGQKRIDLKNASIIVQQTKLEREQLMKSIEQEVKDAWLDASSLHQTLAALQVQVKAANQSYIDLQNQYKAGDALSVDVLSALSDLNTARKDLSLETYRLQVALRNLEQVAGTFQTERVRKTQLP